MPTGRRVVSRGVDDNVVDGTGVVASEPALLRE
jgi:hypothetical protein